MAKPKMVEKAAMTIPAPLFSAYEFLHSGQAFYTLRLSLSFPECITFVNVRHYGKVIERSGEEVAHSSVRPPHGSPVRSGSGRGRE